MNTRLCALALLMHASALPAVAAPNPPCPQGWLGIQAQVTRVSPASTSLGRLPAGARAVVPLSIGGVLCEGDTLQFPTGSGDVVVDLYEAGRIVSVEARKGPYKVMDGVRAKVSAAAAYINAALEGIGELGLPQSRPQPTASRGGATAETSSPIRAVKPLRDLPRQRLTPDVRPIVGWLGGAGPYACLALDDDGEPLWNQPGIDTGWCNYATDLARAKRLIVRDAQGRSAGWNVAPASAEDVPRPPWVAVDAIKLSHADSTAWGIWLWQSAGPEWRLQAIGMLDAASKSEWLARYFVDSVLGEVPVLAPR